MGRIPFAILKFGESRRSKGNIPSSHTESAPLNSRTLQLIAWEHEETRPCSCGTWD